MRSSARIEVVNGMDPEENQVDFKKLDVDAGSNREKDLLKTAAKLPLS